jgi:hypothetical protein
LLPAELLLERREGGRVGVVAVDVAQQREQLGEGVGIRAAALLDALLGAGLELLEPPALLGDADDGRVEHAAPHHALQRGEDLLEGEVARGAVEDEASARSARGALTSLLPVAAEGLPHRREHAVGVVGLAARR